MKDIGPKKRPFSLGVTSVITTREGTLVYLFDFFVVEFNLQFSQ